MSLKRSAMEAMEAWYARPGHKALLVDGARQVGKTFLVREFARAHYEAVLEINFIKTPAAKEIFAGDLDADTLIMGLTAFSGTALAPGRSLVFLDEVQECPRARTAIKFLVDDGRFDYIESGSLLGVNYKEPPSLPVGYEERLQMYPLTFEEFCWACGVQPQTLEVARACLQGLEPVPEPVHQRLLTMFRRYLVVGGMPAVVQRFADTHDVAQVIEAQSSIVALYRQDVARYAPNKMHVRAIFDAVPSELAQSNRRFKLSDLAKTARMERYASDFMWLADAGVALPCRNVNAPVRPLAINEERRIFKLFLCDTGLLCSMLGGGVQVELLQHDAGVNWGAVLENAAAQMLTASGFGELTYFDRPKYGELDFVVQHEGAVLPIEMKSGDGFRRHASLDHVLDVSEWGIPRAFVFCKSNVEKSAREDASGVPREIVYLPWYLLAFLKPDGTRESLVIEDW